MNNTWTSEPGSEVSKVSKVCVLESAQVVLTR